MLAIIVDASPLVSLSTSVQLQLGELLAWDGRVAAELQRGIGGGAVARPCQIGGGSNRQAIAREQLLGVGTGSSQNLEAHSFREPLHPIRS